MPVEFKVKVQQVGSSLKVTVPKLLAEALELAKGDTVGFTLADRELRLRKLKA